VGQKFHKCVPGFPTTLIIGSHFSPLIYLGASQSIHLTAVVWVSEGVGQRFFRTAEGEDVGFLIIGKFDLGVLKCDLDEMSVERFFFTPASQHRKGLSAHPVSSAWRQS
jgi:hypothetical protein